MQINIPSESILMRVEKRIKAIQELYSYVKKMTPHDPDMEGYVTEDWLGDNKYITGGSNQTLTEDDKTQARENIGAASDAALDNKEDNTDIVVESTAISTLTAEVGKYYRFDVPVETLAITLPTMTDNSVVKSVVFYMTGGTTPAVTFASTHDVYYADGFEIESGSTYEVNALWNGAAWIVASVTIIVE
jgi:hypothetical protein